MLLFTKQIVRKHTQVQILSLPLMDIPITLVAKLGSLVVHVQEYLSRNSNPVDRSAIETIINDPEINAWVKELEKDALVAVKR